MGGHGTYSFKALAVDYDGTLTTTSRPDRGVLEAIRDARRHGLRVVLVTGRIMAELRGVFPDVDDWFDLIVAENGAVLTGPARSRTLAQPVDPALNESLQRRGVACRQGEVLLACSAADGAVLLEEVHRLGLDCHLLYNRAELMVLPTGVTKGTGLAAALSALGISRHATVAVGDAENDVPMLQACELAVAVPNAVPSVFGFADLVLGAPAGAGVAELLAGPELRGGVTQRHPRHAVAIGTGEDGQPVVLPGSHSNVLIIGSTGSGKSFIGGLYIEQLLLAGYTVLVVDYEGDHIGLARMRDVVLVGGDHHLPEPDHVCALLRQNVSVVVDLSLLQRRDQDVYVGALTAAAARLSASTGLPNWLFVDEAHRSSADVSTLAGAPSRGCCLMTWRPDLLPADVADTFDIGVIAESPDGLTGDIVGFLDHWAPDANAVLEALATCTRGRAVLVDKIDSFVGAFAVNDRTSQHVRHWHKYRNADLPEPLRFYFRRGREASCVAVAANVGEFETVVRTCDDAVLHHHLPAHDFSRWVLHVLHDSTLATSLAEIEGGFAVAKDVAVARTRILDAIEDRY